MNNLKGKKYKYSIFGYKGKQATLILLLKFQCTCATDLRMFLEENDSKSNSIAHMY